MVWWLGALWQGQCSFGDAVPLKLRRRTSDIASSRRTLAPLEPAAGQPEPGDGEYQKRDWIGGFPSPKSVLDCARSRADAVKALLAGARGADLRISIVSKTKLRLRSFHHRGGWFFLQPASPYLTVENSEPLR
jgi:hypothetical protein